MTVYVFTGPTLSAADARAELDAVYLPPVSQGDVYRVGLLHPAAIGIIDGYFDRVPSVWHKEILWAMAQGIHVYGSASMGALRAAELAAFGMEGVGDIFEAYLDGIIDDDDEVAVIHGTADTGYHCLSVAMVDIRPTLNRAAAEGVVSASTGTALEDLAKRTFYPERSYAGILRKAADLGLPATELRNLNDWLPRGKVSQKRRDALAMLRRIQDRVRSGLEPKRVTYHLEHTAFWDDLMVLAGGAGGRLAPDASTVTTDSILDELRLRGVAYLQAREQGKLRDLALREAQRQGYVATRKETDRSAAGLLEIHRLGWAEALDAWLLENHLSRPGFEALVAEEALLARVLSERDPGHRRMLDHLRAQGEYRSLWLRAWDKQCRLEAANLDNPTWEEAGITQNALLSWYFGRLGPFFTPDPVHHAHKLGFQHVEAFLFAALREFCYVRILECDAEGKTYRSAEDKA